MPTSRDLKTANKATQDAGCVYRRCVMSISLILSLLGFLSALAPTRAEHQLTSGPVSPIRATLTACISDPHASIQASPVPTQLGRWNHPHRSLISTAFGRPAHSVQDILSADGQEFIIHGKFAYGQVGKDLEEESIWSFLNIGNGWIFLGEIDTDNDGRICARVTMPQPLSPGIYGLRCQVVGDETVAEGWLWIRPRETPLTIFDIDGTLTTSDIQIRHTVEEAFLPIWDGAEPELYPGAVELTQAEVSRGHVVVYLTGRPYWLANVTRAWLRRQSFAQGVLHVANSREEVMPSGVGQYKYKFLKELQNNGFVINVAYGNATTDIDAYLRAGLTPDKIFIIGKHSGEGGTQAVDNSWKQQVEARKVPSTIIQPAR